MKVLVTYALEEEKGAICIPGHETVFCRTGIGKVQAALAVCQAILAEKPDLVMNIGSSGSIHANIDDILISTRFIDRDLLRVAIPNIPFEYDFSEELRLKGILTDYDTNHTVSTGDSFVTSTDELEGEADLIDMEAFAIASACKMGHIPFVSVKYVTDIVGKNSVQSWTEKLASERIGLEPFLNTLRLQS
jgi:adenosylhomocysteine nucleosidase